MKSIILAILLSFSSLSATYNDVGTDYTNQKTQIYNDNGNVDLFIYNIFMSFIQQSRPDLMLNKGAFTATLKVKESNEEFNAVIDVKRADNNSPMYIDMWVKFDDTIYLQFKIDEAPSTNYPFGVWTINYTIDTTPVQSAIITANKSGDLQRLEFNFEDEFKLALEYNAITKDGTSATLWDVNGTLSETQINYNDKYMDLNTTHYVDLKNYSSTRIYEYALFDANGKKISIKTGINFEFTNNGINYYGYSTTNYMSIFDSSTISDVNISSGIYDDQVVTDDDGVSYIIVDSGIGTRILIKDGAAIIYDDPIALTSDSNSSLTANFKGSYLDAWDSVSGAPKYFANGESFNVGTYYIKQVFGVREGNRVLKNSVVAADKPSTSLTLTFSTLLLSNVKNLIGDIPLNAPYKLKFGQEVK